MTRIAELPLTSLLIVALLHIAVPASLAAATGDEGPGAGEYRIGPEDVLDVAIFGHPDLARVVPVRPDGRISLPLVNDVLAAGLTAMELRDILTEKIAVFIPTPEVSVVVREIHSVKVSVIGNVKKPGRFELKSRATVLDVLALAEGFTDFAARRRVVILRGEGSTVRRLRFDYDDFISEGSGGSNLSVQHGDIVVVP